MTTQRNLFDHGLSEPPSAAELTRRQRERVIDVVWKSPGVSGWQIAVIVGIDIHSAFDRLCEAEKSGDVHCRLVSGGFCGWFAGPGRDKG